MPFKSCENIYIYLPNTNRIKNFDGRTLFKLMIFDQYDRPNKKEKKKAQYKLPVNAMANGTARKIE